MAGTFRKEDFMRLPVRFFLLVLLVCTAVSAQPGRAENPAPNSPLGRWKTVDDITGKAKSIVLIWEQNGKLFGKVQKLVDPDPKDPNPRCQDCSGEQKGKPVVGLQILQNLSKDKDGWSGGTILDPATGKIYKCLVSVLDGGAKLKVRGFIGVSLLGRTQYWQRQ
jgi:uncharacterized protein (DUF2147 family)